MDVGGGNWKKMNMCERNADFRRGRQQGEWKMNKGLKISFHSVLVIGILIVGGFVGYKILTLEEEDENTNKVDSTNGPKLQISSVTGDGTHDGVIYSGMIHVNISNIGNEIAYGEDISIKYGPLDIHESDWESGDLYPNDSYYESYFVFTNEYESWQVTVYYKGRTHDMRTVRFI